MSGAFNGDKLLLARSLRGWTQGELGDRVAASPTMISLIENQKKEPSDELAAALGEALGFSPSFFFGPHEDPLREGEYNFRCRARTPEKTKRRIIGEATLLASLVAYLKRHIDFPKFSIPAGVSERSPAGIERIAERCRLSWGLELEAPIDSVVRVLERQGVAVVLLDQDSDDVDGFSRLGPTPFVVLNSAKESPSRSRFDAAHELGHLILHAARHQEEQKIREEEAHRFGAAFLLPRAAFTAEFHQAFSRGGLEGLLELKQRWKVSVAAMLHRAHELNALSSTAYRRSYKKLSSRGWRRGEPLEPDQEQPSLIRRALDLLRDSEGISPYQVAQELGWAPATLQALTGVDVELPKHAEKVIPLASWRGRVG